MKALIKPELGTGLQIKEMPIPQIGETDVLIHVIATSICGSDLPIFYWDDPWTKSTIKPGTIIGHEFCGTVVDVGKSVQNILKGEIVTAEGHLFCGKCWHCYNNESHLCPNARLLGFDFSGVFAEYISIPARNIIRLTNIRNSIGAVLDPVGNAVHAITKISLTNQSVLITGCGPLGLMTISLAKLSGARIIFALDLSDYRLELASRLGASYTLNARNVGGKTVKIIEENSQIEKGVDVFIEMSGSPEAFKQGLRLLRNGGHAILMGLPKKSFMVDMANDVIAKGLTLHGVIGRKIFSTWNQTLAFACNPIFLNDLDQIITHRLMIDDFERGFDLMKTGQSGKVLLFFSREELEKSL